MARTSNFLILFNTVMLILGVIMFGMAIYTKQNFTDKWANVLSTGAVWIGIFAGLFMMMISFLGCYAARKNKKALLCLYLFCVCILLALQSAAAAVLINYAGRFRSVAAAPAGSLTNGDDITVNNAVMSVYNHCCSGCDDAAVMSYTNNAKGCQIPQPRFCNGTRQVQEAQRLGRQWSPVPCDIPGPCLLPTDTNCWKINDGSIPRGNLDYPPVSIDRTFCTLLMGLSEGGRPLVDFPQHGGCGNGKVASFLSALDSYFSPKMYYAGVVFAMIAAIQGSILFVGCYVICFVSKRDVLGEDYD